MSAENHEQAHHNEKTVTVYFNGVMTAAVRGS